MKNLKLKRLMILSFIEKKAKIVDFVDGKNIIIGDNSTGKSLLIKLIFETMGASTHLDSKEIKSIDPITLLKFSISEENLIFFQFKKKIYLLDNEYKLLKKFNSITEDLSPFLAEKLNIKLKLLDRQFKMRYPTPDIIFLPFFIDQDNSWNKNFNSFKKLTQFQDWKKNFGEYISGKSTNEILELKEEIKIYQNNNNELKLQIPILNKVLDNNFKFNNIIFSNINPKNIEEDFKQLTEKIITLKEKENKCKSKLIACYNKHILIDSQIKITKCELRNLNKDFEFLSNQNLIIECPTCGTIHDNSFNTRLEIASNTYSLNELLGELINEQEKNTKKIKELEESKKNIIEELNNLDLLIKNDNDNIDFKSILLNEGKKIFSDEIKNQISDLKLKIKSNEIDIEDMKVKKNDLNINNKNNFKNINKFFKNNLEENFKLLNVTKYNLRSFDFHKIPILSGSPSARSILAYYYAILNTIIKQSNYFIAPLVIDTPNQQGQDILNLDKIYEFINSNHLEEIQLILGTEDLKNIDIEANRIELEKKHSMLNEEDYYKCEKKFTYILNQISNEYQG